MTDDLRESHLYQKYIADYIRKNYSLGWLKHDDVELLESIGRGDTSSVRKLRWKEEDGTTRIAVVKLFEWKHVEYDVYQRNTVSQIMQEVEVYSRCYEDRGMVIAVYTRYIEKYKCTLGLVLKDLSGWRTCLEFANRGICFGELLWIGLGVLIELNRLVSNSYVHGDLKCDNVLVNPDTKIVQVIDFSLSSSFPSPMNCKVDLQQSYHLPNDGEYTETYDVYSFGAFMYALIYTFEAKEAIVNGRNPRKHNVREISETQTHRFGRLLDLIRSCLSKDAGVRPTVQHVYCRLMDIMGTA